MSRNKQSKSQSRCLSSKILPLDLSSTSTYQTVISDCQPSSSTSPFLTPTSSTNQRCESCENREQYRQPRHQRYIQSNLTSSSLPIQHQQQQQQQQQQQHQWSTMQVSIQGLGVFPFCIVPLQSAAGGLTPMSTQSQNVQTNKPHQFTQNQFVDAENQKKSNEPSSRSIQQQTSNQIQTEFLSNNTTLSRDTSSSQNFEQTLQSSPSSYLPTSSETVFNNQGNLSFDALSALTTVAKPKNFTSQISTPTMKPSSATYIKKIKINTNKEERKNPYTVKRINFTFNKKDYEPMMTPEAQALNSEDNNEKI